MALAAVPSSPVSDRPSVPACCSADSTSGPVHLLCVLVVQLSAIHIIPITAARMVNRAANVAGSGSDDDRGESWSPEEIREWEEKQAWRKQQTKERQKYTVPWGRPSLSHISIRAHSAFSIPF